MVPVGRLVLLRSVPKSQFVAMMSWVLVPAMMGPMVGPLLGGYLTTYWSWRWIFYINVPLGLVGMVLATLFIPQIKEAEKKPFDLKGSILSGVTLSSFLFVLESMRGDSLPIVLSLSVLLVSVIFGTLYVRHARIHPSPVLDFRLLRIHTFFVAGIGGVLFRLSFGAFPFLLPLMLQLGFGVTAAAPVVRILGYRNILIWNGIICSAFIVVCGLFRPEWPITLIYFALLLGGVFRSMQYTAYGTLAYADIPAERTGAAIGFHSMIQQFSVTLGVAASAGILSMIMVLGGRDSPSLGDFTLTFFAIATVSLVAVPICVTLARDAGAELSGHRSREQIKSSSAAVDNLPG